MNDPNKEIAVFGGGCFWCTEAIFQSLRGVVSVLPGYSGGTKPNPTYEEVCGGNTGHVEVIKIEFDPEQIKYSDLLGVFFATHDPTTMNRQGNDVGEQYQSVVFYSNDEQRTQASAFIEKLQQDTVFEKPVVTQIKPLEEFYEAENYHQNYFANNKNQPYCQMVIDPKVQKFRAKFANLLK